MPHSNVAAKVFLDKAVFTPPFLAVTLFLLRFLESGRPKASLEGARAVYLPSLKANLKVPCVCRASKAKEQADSEGRPPPNACVSAAVVVVPVSSLHTPDRRDRDDDAQVWTVAQAINFTYTPPAYRVLFGEGCLFVTSS